jgi:hypothetical protein
VSVGGLLALDQVLRDLVKFDLFWDFDSLSKMEHKTKQISLDLDPFWVLFGIWEYVTGMGCRPMGLPMFRLILYL